MARHPYVAIEGVIGVGKTTLARLLQPELGGELLLEEFEENPFLSDFYGDRERYAFQTQIFFLLSRYRQQISTIPRAIRRGPVVSDYTFAKDSLFAHLNLKGDELAVYERVYEALNEKIPTPDLLVYLRADLDVLMARIAARDRPFERNMDPDYIESVRQGYEEFIANYDEAPVLVIDTNDLNIVSNPDDLASVVRRIRSSLEYGTYQAQLPGVGSLPVRKPQAILDDLEDGPHRLADFQQFHLSLDAEKGFDPDLFLNFIALEEEMGELARVLKELWLRQVRLEKEGRTRTEAHVLAVEESRARIQDELADCLAYLLKLSNYAGIDLEKAYLEKMSLNAQRTWRDGKIIKEAE
ncbi:MAG TPA: deoxynucleoside kinase [Aggregatilineales bacterium]|jgi:deoxyguanosine kinase|nr:deoxynucleoside kinase [Aggregatilineales bacterium]HPV05730.1 deoxynucleoside kinase [Aggregatilineales bacterium]HQA66900.1 deoxynucleoside kinase [Aggregatilineales bacterium]HQE17355.1 deoxynucleoside kinase [Aggregatilineales bacterium]